MLPWLDARNNQLLAQARQGRPPSFLRPALFVALQEVVTFGYSICVAVALGVLVIMPAFAGGQPVDPQALYNILMDRLVRGWSGLAVALPQFLLIILVTWFWVKAMERRPFRSIGLITPRPAWEWARGMFLGALCFGLSVALAAATGHVQWGGFAPAGVGPAILWTGVTLAFYVIQGPAEEVMARGYLLPALATRAGPALGITISALIFAAGHLFNPNVSFLGILNLFLYGVFAALYALREEGLWGIFGFHTAWNWVQGSVLGLEVSGANLSPAPLVRLTTSGPAWWAGGPFGPEGGLVVTITTLLGLAALLFLPAARNMGREDMPADAD